MSGKCNSVLEADALTKVALSKIVRAKYAPDIRQSSEVASSAAQYLRMSTEHQQYSLKNQEEVIREYADLHGLRIVETYVDSGKSGLTLRGRPGLCKLLNDITLGDNRYKVILIYDISRWGRFQDNDEAACYEFMCHKAGLSVHYCAETFPNDNSVSSTLLKSLKRAMASEFSRELGMRVFEAKARVAALGLWAGGRPPFGFVRYLTSIDGTRNQVLAPGERKNIRRDHVRLVPGLPSDVHCVREMFKLAQLNQITCQEIARVLNNRGLLHSGRPWSRTSVVNVLTNPVYKGCNVWAKTAQKLAGSTARVPRDRWVEVTGAFEPIIDAEIFEQVQLTLRRKSAERTWADQEIFDMMRQLLKRKGDITLRLIDETPGMPSSSTIRHRVGYRRMLEVVGCEPKERFRLSDPAHETRVLCDGLIKRIIATSHGHVVEAPKQSNAGRRRLCIDGDLVIEVLPCRSVRTPSGGIRWRLCALSSEFPRPVLLCRLNGTNTKIQSMHLVPRLFLLQPYNRLKQRAGFLRGCTYVPSAAQFIELARAALLRD